ncbi:MAG TPA: family 78 glycoside hydrolase catalytic domain [Dongiaceae bacterium]|nr:family 78 glycoside hydrolase catalytic domain [Dongiaceae bacterium]
MKTLLASMAALAVAFSNPNLAGAAGTSEGLLPVQLRCEFVEDPLGVDVPQPRLFWKLESAARAQRQSGWQILAASSVGLLDRDQADLWDSGKVNSDETIHISYGGRPLRSSQAVFWKVRVWDRDGRVSGWSRRAKWTMGLLAEADWQGKWLSAEGAAGADKPNGWQTLLLRREFAVRPGLARAVVHVCGLGQYELYLNGRKAGADLLSPGWTKYDKTCLYETRDVTGLLRAGGNAIGLFLGNGMYNVQGGRYTKFKGSFGPPKAIARLVLEYQDGTSETLETDERWQTASGPITFSCIYGGEDYDARLEPRGWELPGFAGTGWAPAKVVPGPGGRLKGLSCAAPPIRAFEVLTPISVKPLRPGAAVYDLGQNVSLMPRLSVEGPPGAVVRIIPAELVKPDGSVDRGSCGGGACYWQYTLAGGAAEKWFPKFFYHGCRYLQVECAAPPGGKLPRVQSLEGVVVHSSSPAVGDFECSNPLFNRIRALVRWAQRSNMMSLMTDCPHREKLGWLEEDHLNGPSLRYEFDLARLFTKAMNDMADSQRENGLVPDIAPEYVVFNDGFVDSPEWGSAFILVAWQQYQFAGDLALLRAHYDAMRRYVAYLGSRATGHIVSHGLGDWYDLGPNPPGVAQLTPLPLTATAFYYYDTWILSQAAGLLGKAGDARHYAESAAAIRAAFNQRFFNPATGQYATGSQCANAIPLVMGLAEATHRQSVLEGIVKDVRARGNALTAGDVGYRYLLRALAEGGRSDVIFDVNNQSEKPGYGYQLRQGATSLTEAWDAGRESSQNHFMLGQIMEWFYHDLAGISGDAAGPGFKKVIIKPAMVGDVTWAKATFKSLRGDILSSWTRNESGCTLKVSLPPNTTATVSIPAKSPREVTESGVLAERSPGVRFIRQEGQRALFEVASGEYDFRSRF